MLIEWSTSEVETNSPIAVDLCGIARAHIPKGNERWRRHGQLDKYCMFVMWITGVRDMVTILFCL